MLQFIHYHTNRQNNNNNNDDNKNNNQKVEFDRPGESSPE